MLTQESRSDTEATRMRLQQMQHLIRDACRHKSHSIQDLSPACTPVQSPFASPLLAATPPESLPPLNHVGEVAGDEDLKSGADAKTPRRDSGTEAVKVIEAGSPPTDKPGRGERSNAAGGNNLSPTGLLSPQTPSIRARTPDATSVQKGVGTETHLQELEALQNERDELRTQVCLLPQIIVQ